MRDSRFWIAPSRRSANLAGVAPLLVEVISFASFGLRRVAGLDEGVKTTLGCSGKPAGSVRRRGSPWLSQGGGCPLAERSVFGMNGRFLA